MTDHQHLSSHIDKLLQSNISLDEKLDKITTLLQSNIEKYTWVGFYFMDHNTSMLHLGPFSGKETEHTVIPFGKGICGQVALSGETYMAMDVKAESNYIACSIDVRSEIVVPVYHHEKLVAQLDIDSNIPNAFSKGDREFLEQICRGIGKISGWSDLIAR